MTLPLDLIIEAIVFLIVVAVSLAVARLGLSATSVQRRLGEGAGARSAAASSVIASREVRNPFLLWVRSATAPKDSQDELKLRKDLRMAGFDHPAAPIWYTIIRFTLAIGLPIAFIVSQQFAAKPMIGFGLIFWPLLLCGLGFIAPRAFIDNRANASREQLQNEFPDALDLMVVCVEAGLGIEAAFVRVGQEVRNSHPRIAAAFDYVSDQLRAGQGRAEALRNMAERSDVASIRSFAALVIQSDTLGSSIAQTLRIYSEEMRRNRFLRAEEKAMRIPVLLTIPLVGCILPVIITALLLPASIDVIRNLLPALKGAHH